jgi:hypothetical protein
VNTSGSGGILQPAPQPPILNPAQPNQTLIQLIQNLLVGLSAFPGSLVRPMWQPEEPFEPDLPVNWLGFGIVSITPDANAYQGINEDNIVTLQRQELIEISCMVYGPMAGSNITLIRDGFQIPQNTALLRQVNMGFAYDSPARHIPDLVNERWIDRYVMGIFLRRYVVRTYPILNFLSANGTTYEQVAQDENYQQSWEATGS